MEIKDLDRLINEQEGYSSLAFPVLMRKVYVWMTLALIITGITAYGVATSESLKLMILNSKFIFFGLIIAELALVWGV